MLSKELSQIQVVGLTGLGVIYWGAAALTIRYAGHILFGNDLRRFSTFMASIPVLYLTMGFSEGIIGISSKQRLISLVLMIAPALLLDGIAFMWFPTLYENPTIKKKNLSSAVTISRMGAALILFGAGASFYVGLLTQ
jgi:hypothetical protein